NYENIIVEPLFAR
ncbi:hypothetical protein GlitD10_0272, partial [Gloeomargarita lithophora Alchichica-D10]